MTDKKIINPDLSVEIAGVRFQNPIIAASGTFGYGSEYASVIDINTLGGICSKGLTLHPKSGNEGIRLYETPSGLINSIGLENPGIPHFIQYELHTMADYKVVSIINLCGSTIDDYVKGAKLLEDASAAVQPISMIELNISCPNVKAGGMAFGFDCNHASEVTRQVREVTNIPLMVKLSPNAPDVVSIAHAVYEAGADAISLVNTFQAMAIDIEKGIPVFKNISAGLSGPAIRPMALKIVYDVCSSFKQSGKSHVPVIALGGIATWQDAVQYIMAGASAVQIGTATFANPHCMHSIIAGLKDFMQRKNYKNLEIFKGCALQ